MTQPTIRRFRAGDGGGCQMVFLDAVMIGAAAHYRRTDLEDWAGDFGEAQGWDDWLGAHFTLVAEDSGRIVGFFMLEGSGYLNMAFVLPDYRRSGLAGRLYDGILAQARAEGMTVLTVWASRLFRRFLLRKGWQIDPAPPPLPGHPAPTDEPEPIDYAMKLVLA